jgi:hypothetical protein
MPDIIKLLVRPKAAETSVSDLPNEDDGGKTSVGINPIDLIRRDVLEYDPVVRNVNDLPNIAD